MGISYNTSIVRDGLILHLDAANVKSYPGSGATWKDLSGNGNDASLLNGVSYDSNDLGSFSFDGVDDKIITSNISGISSYTYEFFCRKPTSSGYLIYRNANMNYTDNSDGGDLQISSSGTLSFHVEYATTDNDKTLSSAGISNASVFYHVVASYDYSAKIQKIYINGNLVGTRDNSSEPSNLYPSNKFYSIGVQGYSNHGGQQIDRNFFDSKISLVRIYNRVLTIDEIKQNYNALRGRYGI